MSKYRHILVAIDFSTSADLVLQKALDLAQENNARMTLLHSVEYMLPIDYDNDPLMNIDWLEQEKIIIDHANESLKKFIKKHALADAGLHVSSGSPKQVISQFVKESQCDLVVLGSHGRHGISLLLGSTANAVLHAMPCDVLTVKVG